MNAPYWLGCPVWSCPGWRGEIYPLRAPATEWLRHYSHRFNTVEVNSSFYAIPAPELARKWAERAEEGFRFAPKFPRVITHEAQLVECRRELEQFVAALGILADRDRLGPSFLQLPPWFSPRQFSDLESFLRSLPTSFRYAIEVRHPDFFVPEAENRLNECLAELGMDRVIFDSRPLFQHPAADPTESKARDRKPQVPARPVALGPHPFLRLIGRNRVDSLDTEIEAWSRQVADWIREGRQPFVFTHTPDDRHAPAMAARFHAALSRHLDGLEALPEPPPPPPRQLELF